MMMRWVTIILWLSAALPAFSEAGQRLYSDSFKKGPTQITEQSLDVTLTPEHSKQEFPVLDAVGKRRYILRFAPDIPPGDTKILGWFVRLADLRHKLYPSVLPSSQDLVRDTTLAWWLDGRRFSKVPLLAQRVIRVEQFYCVIQVKSVKSLVPGQPYLNQMNVAVQFTNTKP